MSDYICPECGHDAYYHVEINTNPNYRACPEKDCLCQLPVHIMYRKLLAPQAQALAEAREALKPFNFETWASAWDGFPDDFMLEQLSITVGDLRKAAEWLKKYP